jgi:hypothetical protein
MILLEEGASLAFQIIRDLRTVGYPQPGLENNLLFSPKNPNCIFSIEKSRIIFFPIRNSESNYI